jgi:NAD(P)-dependent dehydrogenase (short-subunit alcohol dehydrogenase family)
VRSFLILLLKDRLMNQDVAAWGSAHVVDLLARMQATRQQLQAKRLISSCQGGSISLKTTTVDLYKNPLEALLMQEATSAAPILARLAILRSLAQLANLPEAELQRELEACRLTSGSSRPGETALLHACLPVPAAVLITHPAVLVVGCSANWREQAQAILGDQIVLLEYAALGTGLFNACAEAARVTAVRGLYLRYRGLLVWADDLEKVCEAAKSFAERVHEGSTDSQPLGLASVPISPSRRVAIAQYRQEISRALKVPQLLSLAGDLPPGADTTLLAAPGVPSVAHCRAAQRFPAWDPALGLTVHAPNAEELELRTELLLSDLQIRSEAGCRGVLELLPLSDCPAAPAVTSRGVFTGEVAMVTGAATGIGRAAVQSLLDRGAAVIGLDIKPQITSTFACSGYLGLEVDLTDEAVTLDCLEKAVRAFGGLDMLVLNAGIFPPSCNLESLSLEHWRQVMQINLDVNITLLREAYPLLKRAPRYGRVLINSSKNVPAPGPGAAAYSASKAALTQLGRVAALEWASSGIRVNMLNAHGVFDTGIWTDEVIHSRAAKYGLTVAQYKTNNLLHVELTSRDLGELIAETLGSVFANTTGAQIPVDGGSDRVI